MTRTLVVLMVAALAGSPSALAGSAHPCRNQLPRGPAVPATMVLWTSCGAFQLETSGSVARLPRHWLAAHSGGTGRRWGAHINLRRNRAGRFILLERGSVVWRSAGLYPNDGGSVDFGPRSFAFASYRRGVFVTDLLHGERLAARGRGLYPYSYNDAGQLLVSGQRSVELIARNGTLLRRFSFRARNGYTFDENTNTFYFVTQRGILAAARGAHVRLFRSVSRLDGILSVARPGLLVFSGGHSITVTRRDGSLVARTSWTSPALTSDAGVSVSPNGQAFAFRLTNAHPGAKAAVAAVYVFRAAKVGAQAVYRHKLGPSGCAAGAGFSWHGRYLLYSSSGGTRTVIDTATRTWRNLNRLVRSLPRLSTGERAVAAWRSDFRR